MFLKILAARYPSTVWQRFINHQTKIHVIQYSGAVADNDELNNFIRGGVIWMTQHSMAAHPLHYYHTCWSTWPRNIPKEQASLFDTKFETATVWEFGVQIASQVIDHGNDTTAAHLDVLGQPFIAHAWNKHWCKVMAISLLWVNIGGKSQSCVLTRLSWYRFLRDEDTPWNDSRKVLLLLLVERKLKWLVFIMPGSFWILFLMQHRNGESRLYRYSVLYLWHRFFQNCNKWEINCTVSSLEFIVKLCNNLCPLLVQYTYSGSLGLSLIIPVTSLGTASQIAFWASESQSDATNPITWWAIKCKSIGTNQKLQENNFAKCFETVWTKT